MTSNVEQTHDALRRRQNDNPLITEENVFSVMEDAMDGEWPRDAHGCKACEHRGLAMLLWQREKMKQEKHMQTSLIRKVPQMIISTLLGLLLGVAAYADTATAVAEPVTTQSVTASASAHTPAHAVTLYGLTLGEVLPQLPKCTDNMLWYSKGDGPCIDYADGTYSTMGPHLKYGTADEVGIYFPRKMMIEGYPKAIAVGLDKDGRMVYFSFYAYGQNSESSDELYPQATTEDQQRYMAMLKMQLGEATIFVTKRDDMERLQDIPVLMWMQAGEGAIVAIWNKEYAWARYVGRYGEFDEGYLEIGLKSMLVNDLLPEW